MQERVELKKVAPSRTHLGAEVFSPVSCFTSAQFDGWGPQQVLDAAGNGRPFPSHHKEEPLRTVPGLALGLVSTVVLPSLSAGSSDMHFHWLEMAEATLASQ